MHASPELLIVSVLCLAMVLGAALKLATRLVKIPYTIAIMFVGLAVGSVIHFHLDPHSHGLWAPLASEHPIAPDLIIFAFLPLLVFESAYSLDVHRFQKNLGPVLILAMPALLVCTFLTGFVVFGLTGLFGWDWSLLGCLLFGALISATDPVAVVALLREQGAPKRLGILIEGESLLNDGTAIVVFSVLFELIKHETSLDQPLRFLTHFVWVAGGGVTIGLLLAALISNWLKRIFNEPLIEITLTLVLAYGCMIIAEGMFHVSGVLACVTAGLYLKGPGRTNISPEVEKFLHHFYEMLSYLANTLIFFLVGIVMASQFTNFISGQSLSLLLILAIFVAIVILRFMVFFIFRPVMNKTSDPISLAETSVMAWGGLRGAVSLALALIVSQSALKGDLTETFQGQLTFLTAGVVFLTVVVNGSTMGWLLKRLGFDKVPAAEHLANLSAQLSVLNQVQQRIYDVSQDQDLKTVDWNEVDAGIESRRESLETEIDKTRAELKSATMEDKLLAGWRHVLHMERCIYWSQYSSGTLSGGAAKLLDHEIDAEMDRLAHSATEPRLARRDKAIPAWRRRWPGTGARFTLTALRYDLCRAAVHASDKIISELNSTIDLGETVRNQILKAYKDYKIRNKEALEDIRANLPEVTTAIETRLARSIELSFERDQLNRLRHLGVLNEHTAKSALAEVEQKMVALNLRKDWPATPGLIQLCRQSALFSGLDATTLELIAEHAEERLFTPGETLMQQGDSGESMMIIARGAVGVYVKHPDSDEPEELIEMLGGGDILGEMALLHNQPRSATLKALTTVTVGEITQSGFATLMETQPELQCRIRTSFAARAFDNHLRQLPRYSHLKHRDRLAWIKQATFKQLNPEEKITEAYNTQCFLALGELTGPGCQYTGPTLFHGQDAEGLQAQSECWLFVLGEPQVEDSRHTNIFVNRIKDVTRKSEKAHS